jgi:hypothetical protein
MLAAIEPHIGARGDTAASMLVTLPRPAPSRRARSRDVSEQTADGWMWYSAPTRVSGRVKECRRRIAAGHGAALALPCSAFPVPALPKGVSGGHVRDGSKREAQVRCTCSKVRR